MESEKAPPLVAFASAAAADRRIAGVAAAGRATREAAGVGAAELVLRIGDDAPLARATLADLDRLAGGRPMRVERGPVDCPWSPPTAWEIVRRTGKPGDGPVSRWLNRPVSQRISLVLLAIPGARPIHATIATGLIAIAMAASLLLGGQAGLILGGLLFQVASIVDGVDGEMARATFRASDWGAAIDSAVDLATNFAFILCLTVALALRDGPLIGWVGGWGLALFAIGAALIGWNVRRGGSPLSFNLIKRHIARRPGSPLAALAQAATIVSSRDFFALLFMGLILVGFETAILYIFAAAATVWIPLAVAAASAPVETQGGVDRFRGAA